MKIAKTYTNFQSEKPDDEYIAVIDGGVDVANAQLLPELQGSPVVLVLGIDNVEVFGYDAVFGRLRANGVSGLTITNTLRMPADGQVRVVYKFGNVEGCCDAPIEA